MGNDDMPLTRGDVLGYDADRMSYKFTMTNGVETVDCEISSVALSEPIGGRWGKLEITDRDAQFLKFRDQIESIASNMFDTGLPKPRVVRIFAKHLPRR
jgi:hypothetical protein